MSQSNKKRLNIIHTGLLASLAVISLAIKPKPILGAERISFSLPVLGEFHVSIDSLELFAKEGKITTIVAIAQQANREIASQPKIDFGRLPDLRQPGTYPVKQKTITFKIERVRQTSLGFANSYNLDADIYLPKGLLQPAPLVVISHGFTSERSNFDYLAEHFASYGYIVLVPEHIGSNREYKEAFLRGELSIDVSPSEFYSRPRDITYLLNALENYSEFQGLIDWQQVGILGHSFGGTTALLTSGATLNQERIRQVCQQNRPTLNVSMLLQCRASYLPPAEYNLRDPRIKAVLTLSR